MDEREIRRICADATDRFEQGLTEEEQLKIRSGMALIEAFLVNQARTADTLKHILTHFRNGA